MILVPVVRRSRALRAAIAIALCATFVATPARAQGTIASTLGPGNTFEPFYGWLVGVHFRSGLRQDLAMGFTYTGAGPVRLTRLRLAMSEGSDSHAGLLVSLLRGSSVATASVLESWTLPSTGGSDGALRVFDSFLEPRLMPGETYWVRAMHAPATPAAWGWLVGSRTGSDGFWYNQGRGWAFNPPNDSPGYDVQSTGIVPEPATLVLVAVGLAGVLVVRRHA